MIGFAAAVRELVCDRPCDARSVALRYKDRSMGDPAEVTGLLLAWSSGDEAARNRLFEAVYGELRRLAGARLRGERPDLSLAPTALVHEAYLKLIDQRRVHWQNRTHFFAIAGQVMRRVLVDHARARAAAKRGGNAKIPLDEIDVGIAALDVDVLALDAALDKLASLDRRQSELVELRFFAGLTVEETAAALEVAPITVKRDWALAKAWLFRELQERPRE
jgi:RNA polymerase sigma factor (TIGR02999 family)